MSNETRRAIDYLVGALRVSVRDGQRAIDTPDALYHVGVILRRMGSDVAALAAILRETQDAAPRRKRKRRAVDNLPIAAEHDPGAVTVGVVRTPGRQRKARNAEPTVPTAKENDHG
jgi:hypothetical protein